MDTTPRKVMTFTWGEVCENGPGMQKIGKIGDVGYSLDDLERVKKHFTDNGCECILHNLKDYLIDNDADDAYVLIIKSSIKVLLENTSYTSDDFLYEQIGLEWDKKAVFRGSVKNKLARHNLCYADYSQEPDYQKLKGRIYNYNELPIFNCIQKKIKEILKEDLFCEGNYYYDLENNNVCGIGYHGDTERRKVIGLRVGGTMNLNFSWFQNCCGVGEVAEFSLSDGDMYIMGAKSVGTDWKKRNILTLRHSAGLPNSKYLVRKEIGDDEKKEKLKTNKLFEKEEKRLEDIKKRQERIKIILKKLNIEDQQKILIDILNNLKNED